jgi:hypothetical protein
LTIDVWEKMSNVGIESPEGIPRKDVLDKRKTEKFGRETANATAQLTLSDAR